MTHSFTRSRFPFLIEYLLLCLILAVLSPSALSTSASSAERSVKTEETLLCAPDSGSESCHFYSFAEAIAALEDGGRLRIRAGDYREGAVLSANGVTITAEKGATLRDTAVQGKAALLILGNDTVIAGLECSGIAVPALNGACIRLRGRNLTLREVYFHDSQQGLLSGGDVGEVLIEDSVFERLGSVGRAHAIYMSSGEHLIVRRSRIVASKEEAHEIKSRARKTTLEDNTIGSLDGADSRSIDLPNGGVITIRSNVVQKGANSVNRDLIGIALEPDVTLHPNNQVVISDNTLIMDRPGQVLHSTIEVEMTRNQIVAGLPRSDNNWFPDRSAAGLPPAPALERVALGWTGHDARDREIGARVGSEGPDDSTASALTAADGILSWKGAPLSLSTSESEIVTLLSSRPGQTASFRELYKLIETADGSSARSAKDRQNAVLNTIKSLRSKFREVDQSFSAVTFKPGAGFAWEEES